MGCEMLAHTFTGTSVRSMLGLEDERAVFERYRDQRRRVRESLMPDPCAEPNGSSSGVRPDDPPGGVARPRATAS